MKRKIYLEIEAQDFEIRAARECAMRHGEKSLKAMLKNFIETEMRNYVYDNDKYHDQQRRKQAVSR